MKRMLIIAYVFPPIAYAGTYRTLRLCKYLSRKGYKISVLTIKIQKDLHNDFSLLQGFNDEVEIIRTATVDPWRHYQRMRPILAKSLAGRIIGKGISSLLYLTCQPDHMLFWIPFALARARGIIEEKQISCIYTSSPPHSEHLIGLFLKKKYGIKWVVDLRDPILENQAAEGWTFYERKIHERLEKVVLQWADAIVLNTSAAANYLKKRYGSSKICTIRNSFDEEDFLNLPERKYERFTLAHVGSIYGFRKVDVLFKAIRLLDDMGLISPSKFRLLFVGLNDDHINSTIAQFGVAKYIEIEPMVLHGEAIKIMARAHLLVLVKDLGERSNAQIPGKLFEYLGTGNKILAIAPKGSEAAELITSEGAGFVVEDDYKELARTLLTEYRNYVNSRYLRLNSKSRNKYSSSAMAEQFSNVIEKL